MLRYLSKISRFEQATLGFLFVLWLPVLPHIDGTPSRYLLLATAFILSPHAYRLGVIWNEENVQTYNNIPAVTSKDNAPLDNTELDS
jgi:hypothetical protein